MPAAKITSATALAAVRQFVEETRRALREGGALPALAPVDEAMDALLARSREAVLDVDLLAGGAGEGAMAALVAPVELPPVDGEADASPLPGRLALRLRRLPVDGTVARRAGVARAPVLLVAPGVPDETVLAQARGRFLLLFVGGAVPPPSAGEPSPGAPLVERADPENPGGTLAERLAGPAADPRDGALLAASILQGAEEVLETAAALLDRGGRELRAKRSSLGIAPARPAPRGAVDPLAEVKARLARLQSEFERGVGDRLLDLLAQPAGSLTRAMEARLDGLSALEFETKSTHLATKVPAGFERELEGEVRAAFVRHCAADLQAMGDLFRVFGDEVDRLLSDSGGPQLVLPVEYLTDEKIRRMLALTVAIQAQYRGEMPRSGFSEYFASIRKYAMVLVMGASMFGLSSVVRSYREYTLPITVMLVLWGSWSVASSTRLQRVENLEKELDAARAAVRAELRRVFGELSKNWSALVSQHLAEQVAVVVSTLDARMKEHVARAAEEGGREKERAARLVQGLDATEKRLAALAKARVAASGAIPAMRLELRQAAAGGGSPLAARAKLPGAER